MYDPPMLALILASTLVAAAPIPPQAWVEPQQSFRTVSGFRVRVDVHADGQLAARLGEPAHQQIERALQLKRIRVVDAPGGAGPELDGTGVIVLDLHVLEVAEETALAWSLHSSQIVHLRDGGFAFASTWEVGDLLHAPTAMTATALRASLQPALEELCALYLAAHAAPSPEPMAPHDLAAQGVEL